MKIGIISTFPPQECGVAEPAQEHYESLSNKSIEVLRISESPSADINLNMKSPLLSSKIEKIYDENNLDVLHIHFTEKLYGLRGYDLSRIRKDIPLVVSYHEPNSDIPYNWYSINSRIEAFVQKRLFRRIDRIVFHTEKNVEEFPEFSGKTRFIPLGTNLREFNRSEELENVLFFGFINEHKNIEPLIESSEFHDKKIVIAGNPYGEEDEYAKEISDLAEGYDNVELDMRWIPEEDKEKHYMNADCVVMPYAIQRASSGVMEDALEFGKPMIGSEKPVFQESIKKHNLGVVTEPTPEKISEAINEVEENLEEIQTNIEEYRKSHSWENIVEQHIEIYEELLS